jgi:hypothetical protein
MDRYNFDDHAIYEHCEMAFEGEWVKYSDVVDLESRLRAELNSANESNGKLDAELYHMTIEKEQAEADNAALVKYLESLLEYESIVWLHGYIRDVVFKHHPGAAILEELERLRKEYEYSQNVLAAIGSGCFCIERKTMVEVPNEVSKLARSALSQPPKEAAHESK